uniref:Tetratricopeptide repeat protein 4 n=1 Tax=Parascaris univalens TaxID=6257 RepID=A0A915BG42_PARUN
MNRLEVLRMEAVQMALVEERDTRRAKNVALKEDLAKKRLLAAFKARNLQFEPKIHFDDVSLFEWSQIEVLLPQTKSHVRVFMDDENVLHWPLLVQYPERGQTDFFTECCELNTLEELLHPLFQSASSWDPNHDFRQQNVRLFVTLDSSICELSEVLLSDTLREVLSTQRCTRSKEWRGISKDSIHGYSR